MQLSLLWRKDSLKTEHTLRNLFRGEFAFKHSIIARVCVSVRLRVDKCVCVFDVDIY